VGYTEHTTGVGNNITGVYNNEHSIAPDMDNEPNITRGTDAICKTKESTIRDITGSASVLVTTFGHSNRMGFQIK